MTANPLSDLIYESKETTRTEFREFQQMFLILGGVLCAVIGMVGILNFFNAIMTGILSRRREFAVLQSIGMTRAQLRAMLVQEGIFYAVGSSVVSLLLSLVLHPLAGHLLEYMFWFFSYHFSLWPVVCTVPVFILLGWLIPTLLYGQTAKHSVVEELRENT
jgi:putative ABC transport system permease protein